MIIKEEEHFVKEKQKQVLYLLAKQDQVHRLSSVETNQLKDAIEHKLGIMGFCLEENPVLPELEDEQVAGSLMEEERLIHRGKKIWYLAPAEGIQQETWRPGHFYLTDKRLFWWYDFDKKMLFDVSIDRITSVSSEMRKVSGLDSKKERILDIIYGVNSTKRTASFAGKEIDEWAQTLKGVVSARSAEVLDSEMETCPECGQQAPVKELLEKGCPYCNWVSPVRNKRIAKIKASA